jgi:pimeloyl-ACP methyl ester carboxylesterase
LTAALEAGDRGAPLVVLLHGFPDLPVTWRRQMGPLAEAGYRVVAPLLRGYGSSPKPQGVVSYRIDRLVEDVAAVVRAEGAKSAAAVVGHDWGGAIAWNVPRYAPGLAERIVVLNSPHPKALRRDLATLDQLRRSWYMLFFQLPTLPEMLLRRNGYAGLSRLMARALRGDPDRAALLEEYREAWSEPGAMTAAVNYYRAAFRCAPPKPPGRFDVPSLLIWGERDPHLATRLTEGLDRWVPDLRVERIPEAGHWVQLDAPDRVNDRILRFLRTND